MEYQNISLYLAFLAGLLSFISPCVLPLIPSYISFVSGISFEEFAVKQAPGVKKIILFNSLMFILGFSFVFIAMGTAITLVGQYITAYMDLLRKIGAVIIIFFGFHIIGIVNIKVLQRDKRFHYFQNKRFSFFGSFAMGVGFSAGWTPCVGPILASILFVAGTSETLGTGTLLLVIYSLGLGVPFFATSLGINAFLKYYDRFRRYMRVVSFISGSFLIVMGILLFTNFFAVFTGRLNAWFPFLIFN
jgi:cytochrome c-type biogenesis protein